MLNMRMNSAVWNMEKCQILISNSAIWTLDFHWGCVCWTFQHGSMISISPQRRKVKSFSTSRWGEQTVTFHLHIQHTSTFFLSEVFWVEKVVRLKVVPLTCLTFPIAPLCCAHTSILLSCHLDWGEMCVLNLPFSLLSLCSTTHSFPNYSFSSPCVTITRSTPYSHGEHTTTTQLKRN